MTTPFALALCGALAALSAALLHVVFAAHAAGAEVSHPSVLQMKHSAPRAYADPTLAAIPKIEYEGPDSKNIYAFRFYNKNEEILGKPMKDWLRFSVAFWHTMRGELAMAHRRMHVFFQLLEKLGVEYWCFHDRDIAPEGSTMEETNAFLDSVVEIAEELQNATGVKVLWGTAQLFKHPRYMHGAATSPDARVFARAAAQVKKAMEVTHRLKGANYVFWGGREGYGTLLNTDLGAELRHLSAFMRMAAAYKDKIGFPGTLLLEPKPHEPSTHQYDWDVAATAGFLHRAGLDKAFKINVECNHATLAGHSCHHELEMARTLGLLGNLDANTGDPTLGWDTDQFLVDLRAAALAMLPIVKQGGLGTGGVNFDAKLRRESVDVRDLVVAHVSGMDSMARGLRAAARLLEDGRLVALVEERYSSFSASDLGRRIEAGDVEFEELERAALAEEGREAPAPSGQQEIAELYLDMALK